MARRDARDEPFAPAPMAGAMVEPHGHEVSGKPGLKERLARLTRKIWWLHSFGALGFGVGVMIFSRQGLAYADKLLMVLGISWLLLFVALRFIVGRDNRSPDEHLARKGIRVVVNYIIKNLYQQMFFFLVPIYASSATWSLSSYNWWLPPVLLVFAVLSTMDLVFDNFIMERRVLAATMYGFALFGVLNLMLPLVLGIRHFHALIIAAGLTAPAVGLLSYSLAAVFTAQGLLLTLGVASALVTGAWFGRAAIPPAPLAMRDGAVGHGTLSSYECLPGKKRIMRSDRLDRLRCGSTLATPGRMRETISHVWKFRGQVLDRVEPELLDGCDGLVYRSYLDPERVPDDPTGVWTCQVETAHGQLLGVMHFEVVEPDEVVSPTRDEPADAGPAPADGNVGGNGDRGAAHDTGPDGTADGHAADGNADDGHAADGHVGGVTIDDGNSDDVNADGAGPETE